MSSGTECDPECYTVMCIGPQLWTQAAQPQPQAPVSIVDNGKGVEKDSPFLSEVYVNFVVIANQYDVIK